MKIYFLSSQPCALFLNELYYGVTDRFERFLHLSLSDKIYARFSPQNALPIGFFIDEALLDTPPLGVEIYRLKDGVAVYAKDFPPTDFTLKPVVQKQEEDTLATVFFQGRLQLSIQSSEGYFNATLPPCFSECELIFHGDLCILKSKTSLGVYNKKAECLLLENVLDFTLSGDILRATLPLSDRLQRTADCSWSLSGNTCTRTSFTIRQSAQGEEEKAREELLAYAFFESVLIGADFTSFLCEELQKEAEKIKDFLGEFTEVVWTDEPLVCGLVKRKKERVFQVVYYKIALEKGKITDITD